MPKRRRTRQNDQLSQDDINRIALKLLSLLNSKVADLMEAKNPTFLKPVEDRKFALTVTRGLSELLQVPDLTLAGEIDWDQLNDTVNNMVRSMASGSAGSQYITVRVTTEWE